MSHLAPRGADTYTRSDEAPNKVTAAPQVYKRYDDDERARVLSMWRSMGRNTGKTARMAGIPRTTLHRWIQELGPEFGAGPAEGAVAVSEDGDGQDIVTTAIESPSSILAALVKLDRGRHLYLDRLIDPEVVNRVNGKEASAIVKDIQAQIQLLTGQPTGRKEVTVRYVEPGALRKMARDRHLQRLAHRNTPARITGVLSVAAPATEAGPVSGDATAEPAQEPGSYAERDTMSEGDAGSGTRMPVPPSVDVNPSQNS